MEICLRCAMFFVCHIEQFIVKDSYLNCDFKNAHAKDLHTIYITVNTEDYASNLID